MTASTRKDSTVPFCKIELKENRTKTKLHQIGTEDNIEIVTQHPLDFAGRIQSPIYLANIHQMLKFILASFEAMNPIAAIPTTINIIPPPTDIQPSCFDSPFFPRRASWL